jgi:radical SAM superfamily enzyme YgiQ (UPF0313 family)
MKTRDQFRVLSLTGNALYHPNQAPQINFPIGPARLTARLRRFGYQTHILDTQAEGLLRVALREKTTSFGQFVGKAPELDLRDEGGFDTVEVGLSDDQLIEEIRNYQPDVIIATLNFTTMAGPLKRQIKRIDEETSIPILVGGVAASMYPELLEEYRDKVLRGKFDDYIVELIDSIRSGEGLGEFSRYRLNFAHMLHTEGVIDVEPMSPDLYPTYRVPATLYPDVERIFQERIASSSFTQVQKNYPYIVEEDGSLYFEGPIYAVLLFGRFVLDLEDGLFAHIMTREGCVFTCEGCHISVETRLGNPLGMLVRPIDEVVIELEALKAKGYTKIILADDQLLLPSKYLPELASRVEDMGFEFFTPNAVLTNGIAKSKTETLGTLVRAGLRSYSLSVESASQELVDQYWDKKIPKVRETTIAACRKLKAVSEAEGIDVRVDAYFVIGHAGMDENRETIEQMYDSVCFAKYLIDEGLVSYVSFSLYTPSPGTISYENLSRWDMITNSLAMTYGIYAIKGEGLLSPRSLEALYSAGWLFANKQRATEGRVSANLEPAGESDPHAHIDSGYRDQHAANLEARYEKYLAALVGELPVEVS